ncbi:glycine oxidase ThiO [Kyrpidia sp.]|uniref:glycine oxidase ThiO n=1 Tax=Kyrpidia sp. TaxID=2073077 RepID=UPI00258913AE|nr:glycine oxidase ThiO [Kyrpidia sp.]MCL6576066.1 glycine oxidase ThiO [Kyrpidia sp.]
MREQRIEIAVIGGGLIGTSIAYHLTKQGVRPWLFEAETLSSQASHAGAGMLGAQVEMHEPGPLFELGVASRKEFAALCESLKEETGIDPEYAAEGMVRLASTPEEAEELRARGEWQRRAGQRAEWWSPEDVSNALGYPLPPCEGALYLPDDHRVEAPRLAKALARGAVQAGATIREGEPILRLEETSGGVQLTTALDTYTAGTVVVAAGAWSSLLLQRPEWRGRVFPVKGEAVFLEAGLVPLRHTVFAKDIYLVPKKDGRMYLGATEERGTWSREPFAAGIAQLTARAGSRVTDLQGLAVSEVRVGLRPWSDDNLPYLGPIPDTEHLWIAAGHGRNGILLTPITGRLMAKWLVSGERDPLLEAFDPLRITRR